MTLYLVRHGRPLVDRGVPAADWGLDPAHLDDVRRLRASGRLPEVGRWFSSPEPKAIGTARLLTQAEVRVVDALREQRREAPAWLDDLEATVRRAFDHPSEAAHEGWEALDRTRERVTTAVRALIAEHPREDLVLVGHGTAWTVLAADLAGEEPDLERWRSLGMPDVVRVELDTLRHA